MRQKIDFSKKNLKKIFHPTLNECFTLGRNECGNDIEVYATGEGGLQLASRLHALFIPDPASRRWIVADVGGVNGLEITHHYNEGRLQPMTEQSVSLPWERRPLCVSWDATFRLDLCNGCYVLINAQAGTCSMSDGPLSIPENVEVA